MPQRSSQQPTKRRKTQGVASTSGRVAESTQSPGVHSSQGKAPVRPKPRRKRRVKSSEGSSEEIGQGLEDSHENNHAIDLTVSKIILYWFMHLTAGLYSYDDLKVLPNSSEVHPVSQDALETSRTPFNNASDTTFAPGFTDFNTANIDLTTESDVPSGDVNPMQSTMSSGAWTDNWSYTAGQAPFGDNTGSMSTMVAGPSLPGVNPQSLVTSNTGAQSAGALFGSIAFDPRAIELIQQVSMALNAANEENKKMREMMAENGARLSEMEGRLAASESRSAQYREQAEGARRKCGFLPLMTSCILH
jgi:hypothetical protein